MMMTMNTVNISCGDCARRMPVYEWKAQSTAMIQCGA